MGVLAWIVLGGIAGWIGSMIADKNHKIGLLGNIVVGIIGALVGGFLVGIFGGAGVTGFNLYSLLVAILGSAVLIWVVDMIAGRS